MLYDTLFNKSEYQFSRIDLNFALTAPFIAAFPACKLLLKTAAPF